MIALSHPREDGPDPVVRLQVETEKKLQYSDALGWNWHKSWNLPAISATLEVSDPDTKEILYAPKNMFAHIFAVKAIFDNTNSLYFMDVGLRGNNKIELFDGKATFSTLKFASTSYNNEGVKFHLLVVLYLEYDDGEAPKMLRAVVSPPIFVDSRKSVRENQKLNESKLYMYIEPFYPDNFTKKFTKRETKRRESIEGDIENSIEGLYSYLTAPNIRHKVKHPVFLCVRFSECINLYYNPSDVNIDKIPNIPEHLQSLLYQDLDNISANKDYSVIESHFVLLIDRDLLTDLNKKKKILEFLGPVRGKGLSIVFSVSEVPSRFVKYENLEALKEQYALAYSKLLSKNRLQFGNDASDLAEPPSSKDEGSEKQTIEIGSEMDKNPADLSLFFDSGVVGDATQKKVKYNPEDEPATESVPQPKEEGEETIQIAQQEERSQTKANSGSANETYRAALPQFPLNTGNTYSNIQNNGQDKTRTTQSIPSQQPQQSQSASQASTSFPSFMNNIPQSLDQLLQMQRNAAKNPLGSLLGDQFSNQFHPQSQISLQNTLLQLQMQNLLGQNPQANLLGQGFNQQGQQQRFPGQHMQQNQQNMIFPPQMTPPSSLSNLEELLRQLKNQSNGDSNKSQNKK